MALADELEKLEHLRMNGTLDEAEFHAAKTRLLQSGSDGMIHGMLPRTWCMLMHLSQLLNLFPGAGLVAPIVMWAISKDQSREADRHGRVIINWLISSLIYALAGGVLVFMLVGIPLLLVLAALVVIFPIVGGIKANDGILWKYPLSIQFMDPDAI